MNLKVGIVGLPNAGKSTLFNALLKKQVAFAANYPFATIEPNVGIVSVPDERLAKLAEIIEASEGARPPEVPATVEFVDIAGLVAGASKGEGLGNKFLAHIREVHLIAHVLRYFPDPAVIHVAGEVDPERDRQIVETELLLADLQTLEKQVEPRGVADKKTQERWQIVLRLQEELNRGKPARDVVVDPEERALIFDLHLLSMKPVLFVANVSEEQLAKEGELTPVAGAAPLAICAKIESELAGLAPEEQRAYLHELGLSASGLDRLILKAYEALGLISFLTAGVKEVRAWTVERGTKAPQAAGVIHTDFEKKFIKADVIGLHEFVEAGGWVKARELGNVRSEGKEYVIGDGDVVEFKVGS